MVVPLSEQWWMYPARVERVIDGDTVVLDLDLGFRVTYRVHGRLRGVRAPERDERWRQALARLLGAAQRITVQSLQRTTFERWVVDVWVDGELVTQRRIEELLP